MKIKYIFVAFGILILFALLLWVSRDVSYEPISPSPVNPSPLPQDRVDVETKDFFYEVVVEDLNIPWDIVFLPDGGILVSERPGNLVLIKENGERSNIASPNVLRRGEGGLLGMTLHPDFKENGYLYIYLTTTDNGKTINRVERYKFTGEGIEGKKVIIDNIPGATYHDGGRIEFSEDGHLYITTGDAGNGNLAQNKDSLAGKILRFNEDGSIPDGNPFGTSVYSYGHRNPQGLAWDSEGRLWSTEHGRSGLDELNLIQPGLNYGWPEIQGDEIRSGMTSPVIHSGSNKTWAPASVAYLNGSMFFGGLKGRTLYEAVLDGEKVSELKEHLVGEFGRIRTVRVGPDGMLYITTSNRDGRGTVFGGDDKIIKINPKKL